MKRNNYIVYVTLAALMVVLDQWSKLWAIANLKGKAAIDVIAGCFQLRYAENPGAAWGFLSGASQSIRTPFFLGVSVLAIAFIIYFFHRLEGQARLMRVSLALILGGAVGNLIDRVRFSYVVDFIHGYYKTFHWPTFNIADAAISVGVGLMIVAILITENSEGKSGDEAGDEGPGTVA